jgi:hypothetical protein
LILKERSQKQRGVSATSFWKVLKRDAQSTAITPLDRKPKFRGGGFQFHEACGGSIGRELVHALSSIFARTDF